MKSHRAKAILIGVVILLIGVALFYYVSYREEKKLEPAPLKNESPKGDSLTHSTNKTVPAEAGSKPEKNPKDGSLKIVKDYVKMYSKNPATFVFYEWSEVSLEGGYWKVKCKYKGISSFNAEVTTTAWFYIQNNKVIHTKVVSKI